MKVAILTDFLIERDESTNTIDVLVSMFPDAEIYTLSFQEGKILGEIEQRKIHSSFLSHKIKTVSDIGRYYYLIPSAIQSIKLPSDIDLVLYFSTGFIQGVNRPSKAKHVTYFYRNTRYQLNWFNRLFASYVEKFKKQTYFKDENLYAPFRSWSAKNYLPFIKSQDFAMTKASDATLDYYVLNGDHASENDLTVILSCLKKMNVLVKVIGDNPILDRLKVKFEDSTYREFWGKRCHGDLAPLMANARAFIDLTHDEFPSYSLASLACGRPVLLLKSQLWEGFFEIDKFIFFDINSASFESSLKEMESKYADYDGNELRRYSLKFNERKFKHELDTVVKNLFSITL